MSKRSGIAQTQSERDTREWLTFPVESPMQAMYDTDTGELIIESSVMRRVEDGGNVHLRLRFTPRAAQTFATVLQVVEEALGIELGGGIKAPSVQ